MFRGGEESEDESEEVSDVDSDAENDAESETDESEMETQTATNHEEELESSDPIIEKDKEPQESDSRVWHTSDMLQNLVARSAVVMPESVALRQLISQRSNDYLSDLMLKRGELPPKNGRTKLPHPKRVLHYLAPKIPAIKHSPDVNLRIQTARSDIDSGVAACLIGTVARICEIYDREVLSLNRQQEEGSLPPSSKNNRRQNNKPSDPTSATVDVVRDRRFEQIVECLLCGVDVKRRKREYLSQFLDSKREDGNSQITDDVEEIVDGEQLEVTDGLNVRDACRASWGLAILGAHHMGTLGGTPVMDLLMALSLRIRELLLSRLQMFLQEDVMDDVTMTEEDSKKSLGGRLDELAEEKAEDAAAAMWTFACVRACTGMRSDPLIETCCSILCQDPVDLRRRAQEANEDSTMNNVVNALARSEAEIMAAEKSEIGTHETTEQESSKAHPKEATKTRTGAEEKEALIDWLSPNELTDVLWALALHGHTDVNMREATVLSVNAAALKEIAFDRLLDFLRQDLALVESREREVELEAEVELHHSTEQLITKEGEKIQVEVVDAAALLASEHAAKIAIAASAENVTDTKVSPSVEKAKVTPEATTLSSPTEKADQVFIETDNGQSETPSDDEGDAADAEAQLSIDTLYFSPHDLCSLAWAVTELRDSLRFKTVDLVVNIFSGLGEESFDELSGADLSNLAWAVARQTNDFRPWQSGNENPACLQLTLWVVRRALIASGGNHDQLHSSQNIHVLDPFQPPELSRLLWAVASLVGTYSDKHQDRFPEIQELATNALVSASSNLSMFSPEDLVRILWAFLEVSDMDEALAQPAVADALGRVFSTVETSIVRWERGQYSQNNDDDESTGSRGGFNSLTALFLRPSLSRHMLDQLIEEYNDDLEEEDEKVLSSIVDKTNNKPRLPRLRDLGIDPNTLAKAAGAFAKVTSKHLNMRGSPILTRVTLKLLTSKNGRLLQEFSMSNLIRACEAAAINEAVGRGEDLVVGQFARRLLQLLNEANDGTKAHDSASKIDLQLSSAAPDEIATLLWSLGELGARHLASDKDRQSAHRKLRLVMEAPLLTDDQIQHLSSSSALKALRGLVALNAMRSDQSTLVKVLRLIEPQVQSMRQESDLCELAESLAVIRHTITSDRSQHNATLQDEIVSSDSNSTKVKANDTAAREEDRNTTEPHCGTTGFSNFDILNETSSRMLSTVGRLAGGRVSNLQAASLCRLLVVYSLLPFQADDLINACDNEVAKRQKLLESAASTSSVEDLLRRAARTAVAANRTVFGKSEDSSSPMETLKKGLKSLFSSHNEEDEISEEMHKFTDQVGRLLNQVTASVTRVDQCMEQIGTASNVHTDTALQRIMEGANFELGRCRELIDNYRRIEFSTGRRRSRYDYERRRDIGKRLLSRLVPR